MLYSNMRKNLPEDNIDPGLWRLMKALPYTFRPRDLRNWVTTPKVLGSIPGVFYNVTIVATDHNRALYVDANGTPMLGYIQQFDGCNKVYKSLPRIKPNKPKKKSKTKKPTPTQMKNYQKIKALLDTL